MKIKILLLVSLSLYATSLGEILEALEKNSNLLKAKSLETQALKKSYQAQKLKKSPTFEVTLTSLRLFSTPTLHLNLPSLPLTLPMGSKSFFEFEAKVSYPLFTGYALEGEAEKSFYESVISKLKEKELKRELTLKTIKAYYTLFVLQEEQKALKQAQQATLKALQKANGFFEQGLISKSDLLSLESKEFEIKAQLEEIKAKKVASQNLLLYLTGIKPNEVTLKEVVLPKELDFSKRADLVALEKELLKKKATLKIVKSQLYPKVALEVALKRFGNSLKFQGDGIRNRDESYLGAGIKYSLNKTIPSQIEATKISLLATKQFLKDYKEKIRIEIDTQKKQLEALEEKLEWAKKEVAAKREYLKLIKGEYENQLADGEKLSRAIFKLAQAKALLEAIKAQINAQKCKILLLHSYDEFEKIRSSL